ncbi:MAG: SDR family oxidoreductase [Rickettsiales bacterium]|jgi:NAD(P)-dependent dehydrogenase (short-subunit alcohol dehydrogenase family)
MSNVLITGCDYGIGFEFARQYAGDGWRVHAVCLDPASREKLAGVSGDVRFHQCDVSDPAALSALADALRGEPIDLLINNAATFAPDGPGPLKLPDMDEYTRVMRVNAVAPVYVAETLVDNVAASARKLMVFIGTRSGSIGDNGSGGHYAYRCSKAALNMAVKSISIEFAERGIVAAVLHPGSVATETRTGGTGIPVGDSVSGMRGVIDGLTPETSGTFQRYDGGTIEW